MSAMFYNERHQNIVYQFFNRINFCFNIIYNRNQNRVKKSRAQTECNLLLLYIYLKQYCAQEEKRNEKEKQKLV